MQWIFVMTALFISQSQHWSLRGKKSAVQYKLIGKAEYLFFIRFAIQGKLKIGWFIYFFNMGAGDISMIGT